VFKEMSEFVITAIRGGLTVDDRSVPDISVGSHWGRYWDKNGLEAKHGERIKHDHNYPEYFPQAASNPQDIWVYPMGALGEFRIWLQEVYAPNHFPVYLQGQVKRGLLPASTAELLAIQALPPAPKVQQLPAPPIG
jgi:hypothetical protein